jgi:hypothetical protein
MHLQACQRKESAILYGDLMILIGVRNPAAKIDSLLLCTHLRRVKERMIAMPKSLDAITDVIHTKHPFPQVGDRPNKPNKSRYERRKVKQYLHIGDWALESKS